MNVTLARRGPRWQLRWTDPATGKRIRRTIPADTKREAEQIREAKNRELLTLTYPSTSSTPSIPIHQALQEAIANTTANDATQTNYRHQAGQITAWFASTYPKIEHWHQVTLEMLRRYADHCQETCAPATTRLRAYLLRAASHHMAAVYNQPDIAALWRVRIRRKPMQEQANDTRKVLKARHLGNLLSAMEIIGKESCFSPIYLPICAVQALAGLRVTEALALSRDDIDWCNAHITIKDKPWHQTKNTQSHRTIPVTKMVMEILEPYREPETFELMAFTAIARVNDRVQMRPIEFIEPPMFKTASGNAWRVDSWSHGMRRMFDLLAKFTGQAIFRGYQPRWLRASFASAVRAQGVDERLVKRYLGHSLGDTLGDHYEVTRPQDLWPVVHAIEDWFAGRIDTQADVR